MRRGRSFCFVFSFFWQKAGLQDRLVDCGYKMVHNSREIRVLIEQRRAKLGKVYTEMTKKTCFIVGAGAFDGLERKPEPEDSVNSHIERLLAGAGIAGSVGLNPVSILTVGSLGTGGVALLYGIMFYNML